MTRCLAMWTETCKIDKNDGIQNPAELEEMWARFMNRYRLGISLQIKSQAPK